MKLSAIITTRNRSALLREAIESVLHQEPCGAEVELIVVDDDSIDDTAAVVASYPGAHYVRTKQGAAAGSRNIGIEHARGEWVAFLDDDDVWLPHKLAEIVRAIQDNPGARFFFSAATICDYRLRPGRVWTGPVIRRGESVYDAFLDEVVSCSVIVVHQSVFAQNGVFDLTTPRAEDRDFYYRIVLQGVECVAIDQPLVLYRLRERESGSVAIQSYRDTMTVFRRYFAPGQPQRPSWKRRQQVLWRTRGWYAHQLAQAARQARRSRDWRAARRYQLLGLAISPVHTVKSWL